MTVPARPSRLRVSLVGALLFGLAAPLVFAVSIFAALPFARSRSHGEALGLVGFFLVGLTAPLGALVGGVASALGDPARAWPRRGVAAALTLLAIALFWAAMLRG